LLLPGRLCWRFVGREEGEDYAMKTLATQRGGVAHHYFC
jgi:hypothetical protein